jgi:anti-sigma factor RsiW
MTDLNCDELVELVTAYLDGTLDPQTELRFVAHLAECAGCDRYLDQIRRTVQALGQPAAGGLGAEVREQLLAAFRDRPHPSRRPD